ncbi:MAG: hypothetical protein NUV51_00560 [Sulfuricaulis sp.]|nr:hypothetical protein [Sulfuricaulis sp.]
MHRVVNQHLRPRQTFIGVLPGGVSQVIVELGVAVVEAFPVVPAA